MRGYFLIFKVVAFVFGFLSLKAHGQSCQCTRTDQYSICNCLVTWSEADSHCRSSSSELVSVESEGENADLSRALNAAGVVEAWIGGKINTGDWRWTSSETPLQGQGCFGFTGDVTQFEYSETGNDVTPSMCMFETCKPKGYVYAAVTRGDTCICMTTGTTNDLGRGCHLSCSGDANERCGGTDAFYLYHTEGTYSKPWGRGLPDSSSQLPLGLPVPSCLVLQCRYNPFEAWDWIPDQCVVSQPRRALCETEVKEYCDGIQHGQKCYIEPQKSFFSWFEASYHCHTIGGQLVEIISEEIYEKVSLDVVKCFRTKYWIGGSTSIPKWTTGSSSDAPMYYTNWNGGFPTFSQGDSCMFVSNYVSGSSSTLHKWGDQRCDYTSAFVCRAGNETDRITTISTKDQEKTTSHLILPETTQANPQHEETTTLEEDTTTIELSSTPKTVTKPLEEDTTPMELSITPKTLTTLHGILHTTTYRNADHDHSTTSNILSMTETTAISSTHERSMTETHNSTLSSDQVTTTAPAMSTTDSGLFLEEETTTTLRGNTTVTNESAVVAAVETGPDKGLSGAEIGGVILIIIAIIIVMIFCVLAIYYSLKAFQNYMSKKRQKQTSRESPPGPFVRDIDFSYMDVSRTDSIDDTKPKNPAFDKERSLKRYNSLDIDKELQKESRAAPGINENMNYLNNQTQTGGSLEKEEDTKPLAIANKGLFDYIDNVGASPKESNLQIEQEIRQRHSVGETELTAVDPVLSTSLPKQKTVIQITTEEDVIKEAEECDSDTTETMPDSPHTVSQAPVSSGEGTSDEIVSSDTNGGSIDPILDEEKDPQTSTTTDGYINDDFEDADYAHPREYDFSYA